MKDTFKKLKDQQDALVQQQQGIEQQKLQQESEQFQTQLSESQKAQEQIMINDNYQKELDRINKKEIALINSFSRQKDNLKDGNADGIPDILEISRLGLDEDKAKKDHLANLSKIAIDRQKHENDFKSKMEEIKLEKDKLAQEKELKLKELETQLTIAKYRDKGTKNSPKKK
jgi:hypothetical protein